jgi:hypothetical protein
MAFSDSEKMRIRHHMGYMNVSKVESFALGIPAAFPTTFIIEGAMNKVIPAAEPKVRETLDRLDEVEKQIFESSDYRDVNQVDEIQMRPDALEARKQDYKYWQNTLGNLLGVIPNPYDMRYALAGNLINVRVHN